jgi:hypothetical protein
LLPGRFPAILDAVVVVCMSDARRCSAQSDGKWTSRWMVSFRLMREGRHWLLKRSISAATQDRSSAGTAPRVLSSFGPRSLLSVGALHERRGGCTRLRPRSAGAAGSGCNSGRGSFKTGGPRHRRHGANEVPT